MEKIASLRRRMAPSALVETSPTAGSGSATSSASAYTPGWCGTSTRLKLDSQFDQCDHWMRAAISTDNCSINVLPAKRGPDPTLAAFRHCLQTAATPWSASRYPAGRTSYPVGQIVILVKSPLTVGGATSR